jgi:hypothetical protein
MTEPHSNDHAITPQEPHSGDHAVTAQDPHHGSGARASVLFTEEELRQFQRSDLGGAAVVVSLMTGIFLTGLLIYTTILVIITS